MNDYKRGIKLKRRLSKRKISKLKQMQIYTSLFRGEQPCGEEGVHCILCCLHCPNLSLCYESWLNGYVRICLGRSNRGKAWCSSVKNYLNREL